MYLLVSGSLRPAAIESTIHMCETTLIPMLFALASLEVSTRAHVRSHSYEYRDTIPRTLISYVGTIHHQIEGDVHTWREQLLATSLARVCEIIPCCLTYVGTVHKESAHDVTADPKMPPTFYNTCSVKRYDNLDTNVYKRYLEKKITHQSLGIVVFLTLPPHMS